MSRPQTDDCGLLLPLKAVDRVLPTFWDGVECPFDAVFASLKEMGCCGCCSQLPAFATKSVNQSINHEELINQGQKPDNHLSCVLYAHGGTQM